MFNEYKELEKWREETGIAKAKPTKRQIVKHFVEELFEMCGYNKEHTDFHTDVFMHSFVKDDMLTDNAMIDAMCDMKVFAINDTESLGYDAIDCMKETVKEVTSRKGNYDDSKGKFIKVITGKEYKADYAKAKK